MEDTVGVNATAALSTGTSKPVELIRAAYYSAFEGLIASAGISSRLAYSIGSLLGLLRMHFGYIGSNRSRYVYEDMLARALPDFDENRRRTILRDFWINHEKSMIELYLVDRWPDRYLLDRVEFENLDYFDAAVENGRGVVLAVPHFGNERIIHLTLGRRYHNVAVVTSRFEGAHARVIKAKLNAVQSWNEVRYPDQDVRWLYRYLNQGNVIQLSHTAPGGKKDPVITFLDHRVRISGVPARLSHATGAALIPAFDYRLPDDRHRIVFEAPLVCESPDEDRSIWHDKSIQLMESLKKRIIQDPGQFYWMWLVIRSQELCL